MAARQHVVSLKPMLHVMVWNSCWPAGDVGGSGQEPKIHVEVMVDAHEAPDAQWQMPGWRASQYYVQLEPEAVDVAAAMNSQRQKLPQIP